MRDENHVKTCDKGQNRTTLPVEIKIQNFILKELLIKVQTPTERVSFSFRDHLNWIFLQRRITFLRLNMSSRHRKKTSFSLSKSSLMFEEPLQFAAVLIMTTLFIFGHTLGVLLSIYVLLTPLYGFIVIYLLWTYCFDLKTPAKGGRRSETFRRLKSWEYFRDYFPVRLIRTKKLDPKKNYILGYHPHGIMCAGAWANFATEATGFSNLFPGIKSHLLTLTRK